MGRGLVGVRLLMDEFEIERRAGARHARRASPSGCPPGAPRRRAARAARRAGAARRAQPLRRGHAPERGAAAGARRGPRPPAGAASRSTASWRSTNRGVVALYAELDDRAERLRDADERKSRFLADMSHELRTPLNSIIALTELLLSGEPRARRRAGHAGRASSAGWPRSSCALVGDLLDIAKIEAGRLDARARPTCRWPSCSRSLRAQLRPLVARRSVDLRFDCRPGPAGAAHRRGQARRRSCATWSSNALKFTAGGRGRRARRAATARVVVFRVRDTGIGIAASRPRADLRRVRADPRRAAAAAQGHRPRAAAGAQARRAARRRDRRRPASVGAGTTFTVRLPLDGTTPRAPPSVPDLGGAVLVVDDDETARYVVEAHLRDSAWRVAEVAGGEAALARRSRGAARGDRARPLDARPRRHRGARAPARGRERPRELPVVVHTSRLLDARRARRGSRSWARAILDKSTTSRAELLEALSHDHRRPAMAAEPVILLADDDDVGRYVIATMLRRAGFAVREAADGAQAVGRRAASPPDLAVLDVKMPRLDGFEACRRLKSDDADAARAGAAAVGHVPGDRGAGRGPGDRRRRLPHAARRGARAGRDGPLAAARALAPRPRCGWPRASGARRSTRSPTRSPSWTPTASSSAPTARSRALFGDAVRRARGSPRWPKSRDGRATSSTLGERVFSVRVDAVAATRTRAASARVVVTLSDVTAARRGRAQRAGALATERTISRTLQQSLLPERLPRRPRARAATRGTSRPSAS